MTLKQVIRYTNADALEATWVEEIDGQEVVVKCQAYSNAQMDMLAADLGADAPQYQVLMDEIAATYVPPPPPVPVVPAAVTMRQARLVLLGAGLLDDVEAAINALPSPQKEAARIEWEYSKEVQRHNGFVSVLAPSLGLTESQLDQMFIQAATL